MAARILPTVMLLIAAAGCQGFGDAKPATIAKKLDIPNGVPWKADKPPEPGVPVRVVATWVDAVRQEAGKPAQRGFGGRVFFYDGKEPTPIPVDGQLVVYAFDETGRAPTDHKPTRRYVFPPGVLAQLQTETELGVSYSVWLGWDGVEGQAAEVSLIARFEPREGGSLIVSDQATNRLPGRETPRFETRVAQSELKTEVRQASHATEAEPEAKARKRLETTTIKLPSQRLK